MNQKLDSLIKSFGIPGKITNSQTISAGHINSTYYVKTDKQREVIVQKINKNVFKKPEEVMHNIALVTGFVKNKIQSAGKDPYRRVLEFYQTKSGKHYTVDEEGDFWRAYKFVPNSVTYNSTNDHRILEETGKAFGAFQAQLSDFPAKDLAITIPHFHNTENRYKIFDETVLKNPVGRAESVQTEIEEYSNLRGVATTMYKMQKQGKLKLRVTHNDTKCNNVLFDEDSKQNLCVIDLDTVMPGLVGFDFGDAIRFAANTCEEDQKNISLIKIDLKKYEAFTKGFLSEVASSLSEEEVETLSLGAITMTIECGLRFLTDYIDGDNYFKIKYADHNLVRARCQLALAKDMMNNYDKMKQIVDDNMSQITNS